MKAKVTILDMDRKIEVDSYETEKEGEEYEKELAEFRGKLASQQIIPYRFQMVRRDVISVMLILCMLGGFSCKTVKNKNRSKADSSVVRTVETGSKWETEVVTEFIPYRNSTVSAVNEVFPFPSLTAIASSTMSVPVKAFNLIRKRAKPAGKLLPAVSVSEESLVEPVPGYYRQTVRQKGETRSSMAEDKNTKIEQLNKNVESGVSTSPWTFILVFGLIAGLGVFIIFYLINKRIS